MELASERPLGARLKKVGGSSNPHQLRMARGDALQKFRKLHAWKTAQSRIRRKNVSMNYPMT